ncbi:MAG TPA: hypothetical protein VGI79_17860 [Caulobacteraceae bacterium]
MLRAATLDDVARLRAGIARIGRLSDNVLRLGRFGIGLDGLLAWVPAVGLLYSLGAGGYLLVQGWRARAPFGTLVFGLGLMGARSVVTAIGEGFLPFLPVELLVDFFRAHKWTSDLLLRAIDETLYVEGPEDHANPAYLDMRADKVASRDRRRVVFLG